MPSLKKSLAILLSLSLCAGGGWYGYRTYTAARQADTPQQVYKESPVERGDLTVGVTETGSAVIAAVSVKSGVAAEVAQVLVKPGQRVKQGDPLVRLSLDGIRDELESLQLSYEKARLSLNEAEIEKTLSELEAKSALTENKLKSETAEKTYALTLDQAEYDYVSEKASLSELSSTLSGYRDQLDSLDDEREDLVKKLRTAEDEYRAAAIGEMTKPGRTDADGNETGFVENDLAGKTISELFDLMTVTERSATSRLYDKWDSADEKLTDFDDNRDDKEEEIEEKIADAKRNVASKQLSLKQYETKQELDKITAQADLDESLQTGENAELLYDLKVKQLENSLQSSRLSVQEIEKQISQLQPYASAGVIAAPCDGLVMSLSCAAGDEVGEKSEVAAIADSQNAYAVVSIDQEDIASVQIGQPAGVTFSAYDDIRFSGVVDSIEITPARSGSSTVTYTVSVRLEGDVSQVYEGMTCEITFITKEVKDVLYVTNRTVLEENGREYVKVKRGDGAIEQVEVVTGFSDGRNVEIKSGLSQGDTALIESSLRQA